uniref:Ig-like domain-containing protein n=1 Tax=Gouania willdenowi TaxID=441366 RepID=A0A8C5I557_GOUWI
GGDGKAKMRPVFKEVFKNQSADLHGTLNLLCVVDGKASSVRWLKNGQPITNDQRCRIKTSENGECKLVIKNLVSSDSGIYTCEAVNKFGMTSYNGNITVVQSLQPAPLAQKPSRVRTIFILVSISNPVNINKYHHREAPKPDGAASKADKVQTAALQPQKKLLTVKGE